MNIYEQILAGLKTKFQGVEDATLQRIASKKAEGVTDESKVNSIVEGISFQAQHQGRKANRGTKATRPTNRP